MVRDPLRASACCFVKLVRIKTIQRRNQQRRKEMLSQTPSAAVLRPAIFPTQFVPLLWCCCFPVSGDAAPPSERAVALPLSFFLHLPLWFFKCTHIHDAPLCSASAPPTVGFLLYAHHIPTTTITIYPHTSPQERRHLPLDPPRRRVHRRRRLEHARQRLHPRVGRRHRVAKALALRHALLPAQVHPRPRGRG